jgi:uridine monophosphate synthetase
MAAVAKLFWEEVAGKAKFDLLCGVPYTALPLATCIALEHNIPMVMRRKEAKSYGTKQLVEGVFKPSDVALIIEDVITSGTSVLETAMVLKNSGLEVRDAIILLDRNQNGIDNLKEHGITAHCVFDIKLVTDVLLEAGKIDNKTFQTINSWLGNNPSVIEPVVLNNLAIAENNRRLTFAQRAQVAQHPLSRRLFDIIRQKQSNLCVAIDLSSSAQILKLVDQIGPFICMVKLHVDVIDDFSTESFVRPLQSLAEKHSLLIFEDRKFADIGNTVAKQYAGGVFRIQDWAHVVNAHIVGGPGVITGLKKVASDLTSRACILVAQMSSEGNLATKSYIESAYQMANAHDDFVIGFITQSRITADPQFIHFTPGVGLHAKGDKLGQNYATPEDAVKRGADVLIVGRGITEANDPSEAVQEYQKRCYAAYADLTV